ncbi:MAG TPA: tyrosine-type recombinase/integrase [Verrucomicrobiae bacterium]|nr:tyrosine-type recombinase/integrase [Verrucomicrobiae bacterium]
MFDRSGSRKYLNSSERKAFLIASKEEPTIERRAFCLSLFYTGSRISEALNVTVGRADLRVGEIVFETLKQRRRGEFRSVPIPKTLVNLILKLQKRADPSARIWNFSRSTAYRMVKDCMMRAGINGGMASPKGLRHGFAVACLTHKIPLPTVKKWLGHARLETTAIYLDVSGDEERELASRLW